jgi:hypothetical protein
VRRIETMAKVYISSHDPAPANDLAAVLVAAGHEVTSTWHVGDPPKLDFSDTGTWGLRAATNLGLIRGSQALVVIASPAHLSGEKRVTGGKFVEAGAALATIRAVFTLGGVENGMLHHPLVQHAATTEELLEKLAETVA